MWLYRNCQCFKEWIGPFAGNDRYSSTIQTLLSRYNALIFNFSSRPSTRIQFWNQVVNAKYDSGKSRPGYSYFHMSLRNSFSAHTHTHIHTFPIHHKTAEHLDKSSLRYWRTFTVFLLCNRVLGFITFLFETEWNISSQTLPISHL